MKVDPTPSCSRSGSSLADVQSLNQDPKRAKSTAWTIKNEPRVPLVSPDPIHHVGQKYFAQTSLHGLKYIFEPNRARAEKAFWFVALVLAWAFAAFMISRVLTKWNESPILVTYDSTTTPIWNLPFPALTICNMNKVLKSRVEFVNQKLAQNSNDAFYRAEKRLVQDVCFKTSSKSAQDTPWNWDKEAELGENLEIDGDLLHDYMNDLGQACSQLLLRCEFEGILRNCTDIFIPIITDEGQCCSFNIMPESVMFKNNEVEVAENFGEQQRWSHWNMEQGYFHDPNRADDPLEAQHASGEDLPRRALAPGLHMGLSILLDVREHEYYCSGTESVGFKALLHTPITLPEMIEYGFALNPGSEFFLSVTPEMIHAEEQLHGISYLERQCYLKGEKELRYFEHYTFLNCYMECTSNFTFKNCGCVAYYMPRNPRTMPICAPERHSCVNEAIRVVEESAFDDKHAENAECKCLPPCSDMKYPHEISTSSLRHSLLDPGVSADYPSKLNETYVRNNFALVHVFFQELHFIRHVRSEFFSLTDFFATIGGLLGLSMGFSILSLVEIVYFFTIRLFCNICQTVKTKPSQDKFCLEGMKK